MIAQARGQQGAPRINLIRGYARAMGVGRPSQVAFQGARATTSAVRTAGDAGDTAACYLHQDA